MSIIHIISHTHWDREWYQTYQQFRMRLVHLIDNLLAILDQDPYYLHFMLDGQTIVLQDYLAVRPERRAELVSHLQSGRILTGPWYILPDEFLVSPEAHIRNLLQGERDSQQHGPKMKIGYLPDTFGHIGQMPQILSGFGLEAATLWRGMDEQPGELWWQAPDGTRIFLINLHDSYSNGAGLPTGDAEAFTQALSRIDSATQAYSTSQHHLVMFGTDHMEPAPDTSSLIRYANQIMVDNQVRHSTLPYYLSQVKSELDLNRLPVVKGELRCSKRSHLLPGVLSTRMWIKQRNQACETLLEAWAEPFSVWAGMLVGEAREGYTGQVSEARLTHPAALIQLSWRLLMENHPHDSICGCSIDQVHDEMRPRFDQVEQIGEQITEQSLSAIQAAVNTAEIPDRVVEAQAAVLVFNPSSFRRSGFNRIAIQLPKGMDHFELLDKHGKTLPYILGDRENASLFNMTLPSDEFKNLIGMVHDGKIANLTVTDVSVERQNDTVEMKMVMSESANVEFDETTWQQGMEDVMAYLADSTVKFFHILAQSSETIELSFVATDVPGCGLATFWLRKKPGELPKPIRLGFLGKLLLPVASRLSQVKAVQQFTQSRQTAQTKPPYRIENEFYIVEAAPKDGALRLQVKASGLIFDNLNRFWDGADCGDEYNYSPPEQDRLISIQKVTNARLSANPVQQTLILDLEMQLPKSLSADRTQRSPETVTVPITTRIILTQGVPRIDIQTTVENSAQDHRLRVHFPAPFKVEEAWFDGHFEILKRPVGVPEWDETWAEEPRPEKPQRAFTSIQGETCSLMVANRGLPEVEVFINDQNQSEIALTLMRCVGWLSRDDFSTRHSHAGPFLPTPGAQLAGKHTFEYSIIPYGSSPESFQSACQQAYAFNNPLRSVFTGIQPGILPSEVSLVQVNPPAFQISAIKASEKQPNPGKTGWIVRGYNPSAETMQVNLKPWEKAIRADLVSLAEVPQEEIEINSDGSINLAVRPMQIVSVLFTHQANLSS